MPIDTLSVRGVRGIRETVHLPLNGKSLLIYGDNGTGKSSFERALRWALLGEEEPTTAAAFTTEESYRRHVEVATDFPLVKVVFLDGSTIEVQPGSLATTGDGATLRDNYRLASPFLRRSELLDVLSSRPVDRFQYLESFLGLGNIDEMLSGLSAARSAAEGRRGQLTARLQSALDPLTALLPRNYSRPATLSDLDRAATSWAGELGFRDNGEGVDKMGAEVRHAAGVAASGDASRQRGRLEQIVADIRALRDGMPLAAAVALEKMNAERTEIEQQATDPAATALIEHALEHFRRAPGLICPVCGQQVDWDEATTALEQRIEALSRYRALLNGIRDSVADMRSAFDSLRGLAKRLGAELNRLEEPLSILIPDSAPLLALAATSATDGDRTVHVLLAIGPSDALATIATALDSGEQLALDMLRTVPAAADIPALQTSSAFFGKLEGLRPQIALVESETAVLVAELELQDKVLKAFRRARQDVARETLATIQDLVGDYYATIHPSNAGDDATGAPSIDVQRHGKGSAFVRGEFHGRHVKDPQWVYSDGHLDTVAICIFLALRTFRARQHGDPKLMVLDDIIISIDLGHARRLIGLLKSSFGDHQIVLLTHNGLFAHWCKSLMPGLRKVQIKSWSMASGPLVGDYPSAREQIDGALQNGTAKEIAVRIMETLDEWTAEGRYAFAVPVPAKIGEQYTLTEIWEPLIKTIKGFGKTLSSDLGGAVAALETLVDLPAVRNQLGAHENEFAREYPRSTMVEIGQAVCQLVDALYCQECRSFVLPMPSRSNVSMMHCPEHHKQYVKASPPLKPRKPRVGTQ